MHSSRIHDAQGPRCTASMFSQLDSADRYCGPLATSISRGSVRSGACPAVALWNQVGVTPTIVTTSLPIVSVLPIADGFRPKRRCQYRSLKDRDVRANAKCERKYGNRREPGGFSAAPSPRTEGPATGPLPTRMTVVSRHVLRFLKERSTMAPLAKLRLKPTR